MTVELYDIIIIIIIIIIAIKTSRMMSRQGFHIELLMLFLEASSNLRARAVKDYNNVHDSSHISFHEGELITVNTAHVHFFSVVAATLRVCSATLGIVAEVAKPNASCVHFAASKLPS
jgi:hypothetical protein